MSTAAPYLNDINIALAEKAPCEITTDLTGKSAEEMISVAWGIQQDEAPMIKNMVALNNSAYGSFTSIPILCKGTKCPYKKTCMVPITERREDTRCRMEISTIMARFNMWCEHFGIDTSNNVIDPKDVVDVSLIKDLVNIEVQIMRAENRIAINADFMAEVLVDIDRDCNPYYGEDVHPAANFIVTLQSRKDKILNQLHSTRKDKASDREKLSPSEEAIKLFKQIREMGNDDYGDISDVEFDEEGNIIQEDVVETTIEEEIVEEITEEDEETLDDIFVDDDEEGAI